MSKFHREVLNFSEEELAAELNVPVEEVTEACKFLHAAEMIDYTPPSSLIGGMSQARLPEEEWRLLYKLSRPSAP